MLVTSVSSAAESVLASAITHDEAKAPLPEFMRSRDPALKALCVRAQRDASLCDVVTAFTLRVVEGLQSRVTLSDDELTRRLELLVTKRLVPEMIALDVSTLLLNHNEALATAASGPESGLGHVRLADEAVMIITDFIMTKFDAIYDCITRPKKMARK